MKAEIDMNGDTPIALLVLPETDKEREYLRALFNGDKCDKCGHSEVNPVIINASLDR